MIYPNQNKMEHFNVKDKLHTDVLTEKYGPIHAVVLRHDDIKHSKKGAERIREAKLVDENGITRTYALTFLTYDKGNEEIAAIDDEIRRGGLIGQTFDDHQYVVKKNVIDVFILDIPEWLQKDFETTETKAKARFTEFYAKKGDLTPVVYGIVLEIYTPDFRDPSEGINEMDRLQINPLTGTLQSLGVPIDEIWARLDRAAEENEWDDLKDRYEQAEVMSKPVVESLHRKVRDYLSKKTL